MRTNQTAPLPFRSLIL